MQGARVQSLVWEIRSRMLRGKAKKKKKKNQLRICLVLSVVFIFVFKFYFYAPLVSWPIFWHNILSVRAFEITGLSNFFCSTFSPVEKSSSCSYAVITLEIGLVYLSSHVHTLAVQEFKSETYNSGTGFFSLCIIKLVLNFETFMLAIICN